MGKPRIKYFCIDCGKILKNRYAKRCVQCYHENNKGKNNPNWHGGKPKCIDCGKEISRSSKNKIIKRCRHCARIYQYTIKPETNPMKGKTVSQKIRNKISNSLKGKNLGRNNGMFGVPSPHGKRLYYKNICFRSSWEVGYATWCDKNHIKWLYEPKTFDLGNCTYTPDFYLPKLNRYVEIKGYWRDRSKLRFNLFKRLYNKCKIELITEKEYKCLN
jgi:predicted nuclease of restriction endonuclease-like RecB superfamily